MYSEAVQSLIVPSYGYIDCYTRVVLLVLNPQSLVTIYDYAHHN